MCFAKKFVFRLKLTWLVYWVHSRGESMPMVQTADGVREPQNRRVEIVIQ